MKVVTGFGAFCIFVLGTILRGWVLSIFWSWFIAFPFKVQEIGIAHAIGISLLVRSITVTKIEDVDFEDWKVYARTITIPFIILGLGWIVKLFM